MVLFFMLLLVSIDQLTKYLAVTHLKPIGAIPLINGVFSLAFVENRGAAFGILQGARWFFIILTIIVLGFMFIYYKRLPKEKPYVYLRFFLILVASGAIGNFIDRFLHGYVVDFLYFSLINFPVFNVADIYVCIGAASIVYLYLFVIKD